MALQVCGGGTHCVAGNNSGDSQLRCRSIFTLPGPSSLAFLIGGNFWSVLRKAWLMKGPSSLAEPPWDSRLSRALGTDLHWDTGLEVGTKEGQTIVLFLGGKCSNITDIFPGFCGNCNSRVEFLHQPLLRGTAPLSLQPTSTPEPETVILRLQDA